MPSPWPTSIRLLLTLALLLPNVLPATLTYDAEPVLADRPGNRLIR